MANYTPIPYLERREDIVLVAFNLHSTMVFGTVAIQIMSKVRLNPSWQDRSWLDRGVLDQREENDLRVAVQALRRSAQAIKDLFPAVASRLAKLDPEPPRHPDERIQHLALMTLRDAQRWLFCVDPSWFARKMGAVRQEPFPYSLALRALVVFVNTSLAWVVGRFWDKLREVERALLGSPSEEYQGALLPLVCPPQAIKSLRPLLSSMPVHPMQTRLWTRFLHNAAMDNFTKRPLTYRQIKMREAALERAEALRGSPGRH